MILAGDIGGTNSRLAVFTGEPNLLTESVTHNAAHPSLEAIVRAFLDAQPASIRAQIDRACFGVAGPVENGEAVLTNARLTVDRLGELLRHLIRAA